MNKLKFQIKLGKERKLHLLEKYHFTGETDFAELEDLCEKVEQVTQIEVFYKKITKKEATCQLKFFAGDLAVVVAVTLGEQFDLLEDGYSGRGDIARAYMMDCVGMEMLLEVYCLLQEKIYESEGFWMKSFDFIGDRYPIEVLKETMDYLNPGKIHYNTASMLLPRKSVIFICELSDKKPENGCSICDGCVNLSCGGKKK